MSENPQNLTEAEELPADDVQTEDESAETTESLASVQDGDALAASDDEDADAEDAEDEEEDVDPAEQRVFGLPRMCFHGLAFGVAGGYILAGIIGLVLQQIGMDPEKAPSATICAIACAAVGYLITKRMYNRRVAAREAAEAAEE